MVLVVVLLLLLWGCCGRVVVRTHAPCALYSCLRVLIVSISNLRYLVASCPTPYLTCGWHMIQAFCDMFEYYFASHKLGDSKEAEKGV